MKLKEKTYVIKTKIECVISTFPKIATFNILLSLSSSASLFTLLLILIESKIIIIFNNVVFGTVITEIINHVIDSAKVIWRVVISPYVSKKSGFKNPRVKYHKLYELKNAIKTIYDEVFTFINSFNVLCVSSLILSSLLMFSGFT